VVVAGVVVAGVVVAGVVVAGVVVAGVVAGGGFAGVLLDGIVLPPPLVTALWRAGVVPVAGAFVPPAAVEAPPFEPWVAGGEAAPPVAVGPLGAVLVVAVVEVVEVAPVDGVCLAVP